MDSYVSIWEMLLTSIMRILAIFIHATARRISFLNFTQSTNNHILTCSVRSEIKTTGFIEVNVINHCILQSIHYIYGPSHVQVPAHLPEYNFKILLKSKSNSEIQHQKQTDRKKKVVIKFYYSSTGRIGSLGSTLCLRLFNGCKGISANCFKM